MPRVSTAIAATLLVILFAVLLMRPGGSVAVPAGLTLSDLVAAEMTGGKAPLSTVGDKVTIVDVWATWCGPCIEQRRVLKSLAAAHPDDLRVVSVSVDSSPQTVRDYLAREPSVFEEKIATQELIDAIGGTPAIPTFVVFDRLGIARLKLIGGRSQSDWDRLLEPYLGG